MAEKKETQSKKNLKSTPAKKETKTTKSTPTKKETKTTKSTPVKKETKITKSTPAKKETKTTKSTQAKKDTKTTKSTPVKKETKTTKSISAKKDPKATKSTPVKKETSKKTTATKKESTPKKDVSKIINEIYDNKKVEIEEVKEETNKSTHYFLKTFLIIFISMLFVEFTFKIIAFKNVLGLELFRIITFNLSTSLLLALVCCLFNEKVNKIISLIFVFWIGFYSMLQLTFYNMINNFMSFNASSGGGLGRVKSEIPNFIKCIKPTYLLELLPFVVFLILFIFSKKIIKREAYTKKRLVIIICLILILKLFGMFTVNSKLFEDKNQIKSNKELYDTPTLLSLSLKQFGTFKFFERDIMYMFFPKNNYSLTSDKKVSKEVKEPDYERKINDKEFEKIIEAETNSEIKELHEYFINQNITDKNEYTGYFKGKNLILIMVEAFDMIAIDENITPTLYKIANEGWYFDNYYTPKYSCTTGESEYIAETSIIPSATVCTPNTYVDNNYSTSVFNIFKNSGYYASSYHSWTDEFYVRSKLHPNMGSELYMDFNSLNLTLPATGWPLDTEMIEKSYPYYNTKDKFFTFYITSSTHFPYTYDTTVTKKHWDKVKDTNYSINVKRYMAKAAELDEMLELLMNKLKEDKILDDTVIVLFGDHHPLNLGLDNINEYSSIDRYEDFNEDKLPFIIYNTKLEGKKISKTASTFDIIPTLANLFDAKYDPRYYVGVDAFSKDESIVIFTNGSWLTDKGLYDSTKNLYKSFGEEMSNEYITEINKKVNDKFYVSNKVLTLDYFKYRFKAQ